LGACPVEAKVSAAFTTAERTISLRCERACTYRARLLLLPRRNTMAVVTGKARARSRVRLKLDAAETTPGWHQLSISFLDAALPGRPVERVSMPFVVRASLRPRSLPAAEAVARMAPRYWLEP
jgi:hypothetical protein